MGSLQLPAPPLPASLASRTVYYSKGGIWPARWEVTARGLAWLLKAGLAMWAGTSWHAAPDPAPMLRSSVLSLQVRARDG